MEQKDRKQKHQFKESDYCVSCQQKKGCGVLDPTKKYCCACYRKVLEELEWEELLVSSAQQTLNDYRRRIIKCQCLGSEKPRVKYISSDGNGWTVCERCEKIISSAGHHGVVRNRNNPEFWGIGSERKILCLECIGKEFYKEMEGWQKKKFREYRRRGYG